MKIADWLTYTDIDQLRQLNRFYGNDSSNNSKNDLICSLLRKMNHKSFILDHVKHLTSSELRFLQLMVLDTSSSYTMEELVAKGRAALSGEEGEPRRLIVSAIKRGWLFRGYSHSTQNLYQVPTDTKERFLELFFEPFNNNKKQLTTPEFYRDEENLMVADLYHFLLYLQKEVVRISGDGSIYRNQQKTMFQGFFVVEQSITQKGPRFGFGRNYHLYPDRFSVLYDYSFYKGYIQENPEGYVSLTDVGIDRLLTKDPEEGKHIYRFWIRLYRKPIVHLPIIIRWISLLGSSQWISLDTVFEAVQSWVSPYYYESVESLFQRVIKMLLHLGVLKIGTDDGENYIILTLSGKKWLQSVSVFKEKAIEDGFIRNA